MWIREYAHIHAHGKISCTLYHFHMHAHFAYTLGRRVGVSTHTAQHSTTSEKRDECERFLRTTPKSQPTIVTTQPFHHAALPRQRKKKMWTLQIFLKRDGHACSDAIARGNAHVCGVFCRDSARGAVAVPLLQGADAHVSSLHANACSFLSQRAFSREQSVRLVKVRASRLDTTAS